MGLKTIFKTPSVNIDIVENYPDAVIVINYQRNIVLWNKMAYEIFGYSKREVTGKNIGIIFNEDIEKIYQNLTDNKSTIFSAKTKSGKDIYVEITCSDQDNGEGVIISARDVTKKQKILEKLIIEYESALKISQNKSSFIANLSHELRTPMHSVIGFAQALLDGLAGELGEKQEKYVSIISRNANSLLALLNSILDLSKIEAGKMEINFKTFDAALLINSVTETVMPSIEAKNLEFSADLSGLTKKNIFTDENALRQILMNLLTNAVKFTDSGSIKLTAVHPNAEFLDSVGIELPEGLSEKSYLMISISDTGIGIPKEELNNIFDEYRQINRPLSKKHGGTGLGLAITRKILHELEGIIWVESEPGQGSIFNIIMPIERPKNKEE